MDDEEIAEQLNRSIDSIVQRRNKQPQRDANSASDSYIDQLHEKHFWGKAKTGLLDDEITFFEDSWAALFAQFFHQGVTATDEMMMKDVIFEDILLHRALAEKKNIIDEIKEFEAVVESIKQIPLLQRTEAQADEAVNAHRTVVQLRGSQEAYTKEINDIKKVKDSKFKDLKATRNERLKSVEEAGKNIFALVKHLNEDKMRQSEGRMAGLVLEAANKKQAEFSQNMVFADGEVDRPWTTPEAELADDNDDTINETDKET